jgi:hypothetical protein
MTSDECLACFIFIILRETAEVFFASLIDSAIDSDGVESWMPFFVWVCQLPEWLPKQRRND